jgi:protein-L-isoaspartate(D-aspartate) O-methyltransferase
VERGRDRKRDQKTRERSATQTTPEALVRAASGQGVTDPRVLEALGTVARASFVPSAMRDEVGYDCAIAIGHAQTTSQPSLIALMLEALEITSEDTVLEVGTGLGYQAALLAHLARQVFSLERIVELAEAARTNLEREEIFNVEVVTCDGTLGLVGEAPFDAIVVSAAFLSVPAPLVAQLAVKGRLVMPLGNGGDDIVKVFEKRDDKLAELSVLCGARFVPLVGVNGFPTP